MSLDRNARTEGTLERLAPRMVALICEAASEALRLHANAIAVEHLLCATMRDEDCAAYEVVCHAFADPDTVFEESLALAPGLLVVASASTLPFSEGAVQALHAAFDSTASSVEVRCLVAEAFRAMSPSQRALLADIGFDSQRLSPPATSSEVRPPVTSLFAHFDDTAKTALSRSNRAAASLRASAIGPAHLFLGCLQAQETLPVELELNYGRARLVLSQDHADPTPPTERRLELEPELATLLESLPEGAGSLAFLAALHGPATRDLATLLGRHKITKDLLRRSAQAFRDPVE